MSNNSYNAGYHRGLNSEYHDRDVYELYKEWVEGTRFLLVPTTNDPVAFEEGFDDELEIVDADAQPDAHDRPHQR